jgi:capsular polysaccharide biosynthesis protein
MSKRSRSFETNAIYAPRIHYERVVYDKLRVLWRQKPLVAAVLGIALAALSVALLLIAPRYTGEAMIQLDFTRNETVAGEKVQSIAAVDAAALVGGAARIIRSRGTASAVVSVLGLDNDPAYTHQSLPARALSSVWSVLGLPAPTPRDLAVERLMRQTTVTNDPRSYLITVAVTASDPERAAQLANWVASEYLRGRLREQAIEAYAVAEREMTSLSSVFGPRHPSYLNGSAKLGRLKAQLAAAREGGVTEEREAVVAQDMVRFAVGQSLLPAEAVMVPSGPNTMLLFALTILAALAVGILLSSLAERGLLRWSVPLPALLRSVPLPALLRSIPLPAVLRSIPLPAVLRAWSPAPLAGRGLSWWRNSVR